MPKKVLRPKALSYLPLPGMKCNDYLSDMRHFEAMNEVFREAFPQDPPARTTVEAALAEPEMLVEIEAVAFAGRIEA